MTSVKVKYFNLVYVIFIFLSILIHHRIFFYNMDIFLSVYFLTIWLYERHSLQKTWWFSQGSLKNTNIQIGEPEFGVLSFVFWKTSSVL